MVSMAPLVTPISKDLEISNSTMGLILGAWPLTYIVAALPAGILLDRFGARSMLFLAAFIIAMSALGAQFGDDTRTDAACRSDVRLRRTVDIGRRTQSHRGAV